LYNPSTTVVPNQIDFYLTDDLAHPAKWQPAYGLVSVKGYSLLYFEREEFAGHSNFKLKPEGGSLYLLNSSLQVIDSVVYPLQYRNCSYGRKIDAGSEWVYFESPSPGASNNGKGAAAQPCTKPIFSLSGGFYKTAQLLSITCDAPDTVYYTSDYSEPTRKSLRYVNPINIATTTVVRAGTFSKGKLPSELVTNTYFMNVRDHNLPVVSISTTQANLTDPKIGMYCNGDGTNGIVRNGPVTAPMNYYCDWDRPVNFELFDTSGVARLNQEVDITILGGWWTTTYALKSIGICPKKKFGENELKYDLFAATKPNHKYRDIQLRNSGNDFYYSMMRDGLMQSIVIKRLPELDYLAYEPAVLYMNGVYWGIENLRERTSKDYLFSNFGLEDDDVYLIEATIDIDTDKDIATDTAFIAFSNFLKDNDVTEAEVYDQICKKMDVDNFISYMIAEIYTGNTDWPHNNVKMWRKKHEGSWRWILFDTDFGMNLYSSMEASNTLTLALGESVTKPDWSTVVLRRLVLNETFRNKFIDRFAIHLGTTYKTERVNHVIDSLASKISNEIAYHKSRFSSSRTFSADIATMKTFSAGRPANMLNFISARFLNSVSTKSLQLSANIPKASFTLNGEEVMDESATIPCFLNRPISVAAKPVKGYSFKQWEKTVLSGNITLLPMGTVWRYYDGSSIPATNWYSSAYTDAGWKTGAAPLGYKIDNPNFAVTTISYGTDPNNKYPTAYFRNSLTISNMAGKSNFVMTIHVDDGAAIYINGTELGRTNLPAGTLTFNTFATTYNDQTVPFSVPAGLLKEGENLIAVEVHQNAATSSDVFFDLSLTCDAVIGSETSISTNKVYTETFSLPIALKAIYEASSAPETEEETVVINEVVASNTTIKDAYGEKDDYIELYNSGKIDVDISGWYISDVTVNPTLVTIPAFIEGKTIVPAKGWLIFWADDTPAQGSLHLPFKLSKDGETIVLSKKNAFNQVVVVDSITYPLLNQNVSYSRVNDASPFWTMQAPTFSSTNDLGTGFVKPIERDLVTGVVWPTLVSDGFTVQALPGTTITVFDPNGKILRQVIATSEETHFQADFMKSGLNIVRVGNSSHKVMKR
jgi:hypothetical protein